MVTSGREIYSRVLSTANVRSNFRFTSGGENDSRACLRHWGGVIFDLVKDEMYSSLMSRARAPNLSQERSPDLREGFGSREGGQNLHKSPFYGKRAG